MNKRKNEGPEKKYIKRPPAVYDNIGTPMGIADECHRRNLKNKKSSTINSKYLFT